VLPALLLLIHIPDILYNTNSIKAIGNSLNLFNNCCKRRLCYNHN